MMLTILDRSNQSMGSSKFHRTSIACAITFMLVESRSISDIAIGKGNFLLDSMLLIEYHSDNILIECILYT